MYSVTMRPRDAISASTALHNHNHNHHVVIVVEHHNRY